MLWVLKYNKSTEKKILKLETLISVQCKKINAANEQKKSFSVFLAVLPQLKLYRQ
jgi:hypothetical protein